MKKVYFGIAFAILLIVGILAFNYQQNAATIVRSTTPATPAVMTNNGAPTAPACANGTSACANPADCPYSGSASMSSASGCPFVSACSHSHAAGMNAATATTRIIPVVEKASKKSANNCPYSRECAGEKACAGHGAMTSK